MAANAAPTAEVVVHSAELARVRELRPHPSNYREHPDGQRRHLLASMREHGFYRNVIVARDGTILAGHGVVEAAAEAGLDSIPVVRLALDADDPRALKILAGDNEIARLAATDDATLAKILGTIREADEIGLLGTGFDDDLFAALERLVEARSLTPTSPFDEWAGMPEYQQDDRRSVFHVTVHFASDEDAQRFFDLVGVSGPEVRKNHASFWWPASDGLVGSNLAEAWVADA